MMNAKIKADWIAALRSGSYQQGRGILKRQAADRATYCCLGVLCELAVNAGLEITASTAATEVIKDCDCEMCTKGQAVSFDGHSSFPSAKVSEWAGLASTMPYVNVGGFGESLAVLNDEQAKTFDEIATLIENDPDI